MSAPQDLTAEEHVLGSMLLTGAAIDKAMPILDPRDFYRESHGVLYDLMRRMHYLGQPVDPVTVVAEAEKRTVLGDIGGKVRVFELARIVPASANVEHYAEIVREHAVLRDLTATAREIAHAVEHRNGDTADDLVSRAEQALEELRVSRERRTDEMVSLHAAAEYLDDKFRNPPDQTGWIAGPWSFVPLLGPGRLYVLGGYPADGKSSGALQFYLKALRQEVSTTFLSMEMARWDLTERLASVMGIPARAVQGASPDRQVARVVLEELTRLAPHGRIWDAPAVDLPSIRAHVKAVQPQFLIVDHLHMFHLRSEYERQDLESVIRGLWRIAREFNITVLLVAQLSRSGDKRHPFPMPTMSALKGSGAIEQFAWAVWFVYRKRDEDNLPTDEAQFICAKNRSGTTGVRQLAFHPSQIRFTEISYGGAT